MRLRCGIASAGNSAQCARPYMKSKAHTNSHLTPERIMQLSWGFAPPVIIESAVRHGLFDLLSNAALTGEQLAKRSGASVRGVTAICNALVGLRLLARAGDRYSLTQESAAFLVSDKPGYHGAFFHHISRQIVPNWLELHKIVQTGRPADSVNSEKRGAKFFAELSNPFFR